MTRKKIIIALSVVLAIAIGSFFVLNRTVHAEKRGQAEITLKEGISVEKEQIVKALEGTHFTVKDVKVTAEGKLICEIDGMRCQGCPPQVESALKKIEGVQLVKATLKTDEPSRY